MPHPAYCVSEDFSKVGLPAENPTKRHLNPAIKWTPPAFVWPNASATFIPKMHYVGLITTKREINPDWGPSYRQLACALQKGQSWERQRLKEIKERLRNCPRKSGLKRHGNAGHDPKLSFVVMDAAGTVGKSTLPADCSVVLSVVMSWSWELCYDYVGVFRKYTWEYPRVKGHWVCNLFSNGSRGRKKWGGVCGGR